MNITNNNLHGRRAKYLPKLFPVDLQRKENATNKQNHLTKKAWNLGLKNKKSKPTYRIEENCNEFYEEILDCCPINVSLNSEPPPSESQSHTSPPTSTPRPTPQIYVKYECTPEWHNSLEYDLSDFDAVLPNRSGAINPVFKGSLIKSELSEPHTDSTTSSRCTSSIGDYQQWVDGDTGGKLNCHSKNRGHFILTSIVSNEEGVGEEGVDGEGRGVAGVDTPMITTKSMAYETPQSRRNVNSPEKMTPNEQKQRAKILLNKDDEYMETLYLVDKLSLDDVKCSKMVDERVESVDDMKLATNEVIHKRWSDNVFAKVRSSLRYRDPSLISNRCNLYQNYLDHMNRKNRVYLKDWPSQFLLTDKVTTKILVDPTQVPQMKRREEMKHEPKYAGYREGWIYFRSI